MKAGKSLSNLISEVMRQRDAKRDFIVSANPSKGGLRFDEDLNLIVGKEAFPTTRHALRQAEQITGIPAQYADKVPQDLLVHSLNRLFDERPQNQLVRTLDGTARAILSDRYRQMDYADLLESILPTLQRLSTTQGLKYVSGEITDSGMYLKLTRSDVRREIMPPGAEWGKGNNSVHVLQPGIVIRNSEVGLGSLTISPAIHTIHCTNLAVFNRDAMRKIHLGRRNQQDQILAEILSDEARAAEDKALWLQVRDMVEGAIGNMVIFERLVEELEAASKDRATKEPALVIEELGSRFGLTNKEGSGVLEAFLAEGDFSRYGLSNAITRAAQDVDGYDRASEMEIIGANVIELPKSQWKELAVAA